MIFIGCGPSLKSLQKYVAVSRHQKIAVFTFASVQGYPNIGQEAADLMSEQLDDYGFTLINRSDIEKVLGEQKFSQTGLLKPEDMLTVGHLLGVEAVLTGSVGEASEQKVHHPAVYQEEEKTNWDSRGREKTFHDKVLINPEETDFVTIFSLTTRLTDVETGKLIWVGAGSDKSEEDTLQGLAAGVIEKLARQMAEKFLEKHL